MKILHVSAYAHRGGCEKNCYHFIKGSPEHSHELVVLGEKGPMSDDWETLGIELIHLKIVNYNLVKFAKSIKKFLLGKKYDKIVSWTALRLPIQLNAYSGVCSTVRVYLGNPIYHNTLKDLFLSKVYPFTCDVRLMACSQHVADSFLRTAYYKSWDIKVSLNPVQLPSSLPQKNIDSSVFKIGMVARLDPIKDHLTLIKAFPKILENIPNAQLHFAGDGILKEKLKGDCVSLGIQEKVMFHGDVDDVYTLLNEWELFVYSTTPDEGLGSVVAEAMANGVPCVLCDLPMMRELAPSNGLVDWFVAGDDEDLSNTIINLYIKRNLLKDKSTKVYEHAQKAFSVKRFINDFID